MPVWGCVPGNQGRFSGVNGGCYLDLSPLGWMVSGRVERGLNGMLVAELLGKVSDSREEGEMVSIWPGKRMKELAEERGIC